VFAGVRAEKQMIRHYPRSSAKTETAPAMGKGKLGPPWICAEGKRTARLRMWVLKPAIPTKFGFRRVAY